MRIVRHFARSKDTCGTRDTHTVHTENGFSMYKWIPDWSNEIPIYIVPNPKTVCIYICVEEDEWKLIVVLMEFEML